MFEPGTILALKDPQSTEDTPYPYDRVKVVGQSPIQHAGKGDSPWVGADAAGFIIAPLSDYAPTLDKPLGELMAVYEVEEYPLDPITQEPITPQSNPRNLPSPEQILARAAAEADVKVPTREPSPSLQQNNLSAEQVLRQSAQKARKK